MSIANATEQLNVYIDRAIDLLGSLTAVGNQIGLSQPRMSRIKKGKEHMPMMAAVRLADLVSADRFNVIVCAEMATSNNEDDYDFWEGVHNEMESKDFQENRELGKALGASSYIRQMMN
ncbi:hypothetical protein [uncultured Dechloromonas sp.]|uniref:hypothetical protein n=1 Tax=uncultured Dechloromonas sp. TaxID=171719 RepID=UPI0025E18BAB|nr:hypothetical protein [uncultured Dechloromonas sp.]